MTPDYLQVLLLAVIQGAAELLPVSSSAHVIFAERLMGLDPSSPPLTFLLVMLHTGTMFAVIVYFWPRWHRLLFQTPAKGESGFLAQYRFVTMVILATVFTGVLGFGLQYLIEKVLFAKILGQPQGEIEDLFKSLPLIAGALAAAGLLILLGGHFEPRASGGKDLDARGAIWIGIVQAFCIPFRGFSRSGATISTALLCGVRRSLAEDFSFALAVVLTPPAIARMLWRLLKREDWNTHEDLLRLLGPGLAGMAFSFLAGLLALKVLSAALEKGRWGYFGYYCLVAAGVIFAASVAGI
jgi:undecaprenyl-diphosphatase